MKIFNPEDQYLVCLSSTVIPRLTFANQRKRRHVELYVAHVTLNFSETSEQLQIRQYKLAINILFQLCEAPGKIAC